MKKLHATATSSMLKRAARPILLPLLRRIGWGRRPTVRMPRITAKDRPAENEIPSKVSFREDQTILLNGAPFFPVGLYYTHDELADVTGAGLRSLRDMGFNIIFFDGGLDSDDQLDRIWAAGLHVWYRPPGELYRDFDLLKQVISKFARHQAVLFWEIDDEPILNGLRLSDVKVGCRVVREIDPYHPILCNQWLESLAQAEEVREWARLADIYGFGIYPVPSWRWGKRMRLVAEGLPHSIAVVGELTKRWCAYAPGKPIIPVLQAWAWDCLEDRESAYPTYRECRFMAYQAVVNGAKGLHHYGAATARRPNFACGIPPRLKEDLDQTHDDFLAAQRHNERFWNYYSKVVGEISLMSAVFTSPDAGWAPNLTMTSAQLRNSGGIECAVKRHAGSDVIIMVNASNARLLVRARVERMSNRVLKCWGRNDWVEVNSGGFFQDVLEPFGVRIYSVGEDLLTRFSDEIIAGDEYGNLGYTS